MSRIFPTLKETIAQTPPKSIPDDIHVHECHKYKNKNEREREIKEYEKY